MGIRTGIGSEHYHHPHTWMFAAWELGFYVYVHIGIEESYMTTSHWLGRGHITISAMPLMSIERKRLNQSGHRQGNGRGFD